MKFKCAALLVGMLLLGATRAGATTYAVAVFDQFVGSDSGVGIAGSITTDGTLGPINPRNIIDWNLIGTAVENTPVTIAFAFDLVPGNSEVLNAVNITATANALTLGVSNGAIIPNGDILFTNGINSTEFTAGVGEFGSPFTLFGVCGEGVCVQDDFDGLTIADGKVIATAAVPEPSTWAMMLIGFAGLGFAFRQSRRRVSFA